MSAAYAYEPEGPIVIGPDPESLDATRPDDVDVCHACAGEGAVMVITGDPYDGGWDSVECCFCHGTGTLGGAA